MFHLGAYAQSVDPAGALVNINAVPEQVLFTTAGDLRIPDRFTMLVGEMAAINDASLVRAQLQAPSLRVEVNHDVEPIVQAAVWGNPPETTWHGDSPLQLVTDESLNFAMQSDPAAPALHYGLVWLADGPVEVVKGRIFTRRATATIAQTTTTWVNGNLTLGQVLPAGRYAVVGMRARSTDAVAMRLVFREQVNRPGVPVINAIGDQDFYWFRMGRAGVWGEFPNTIPPTLDVLGGAAAAQIVFLDLMRLQ